MKSIPTADPKFAALDDRHRRIDGPLSRIPRLNDGREPVLRRDGERLIQACRRAIARRREAVASLNPCVDPMLCRLTNRLVRLRAADVDEQNVDQQDIGQQKIAQRS